MKTGTRLFLTLPYIVATYFYLRLFLPEEHCWQMFEGIVAMGLVVLVTITGIVALFITFSSRRKFKFEPITFTVVMLTSAVLFIGRFGMDYFRGNPWMYAEATAKGYWKSKHRLTLRKDKTYKVRLDGGEMSCVYTGGYLLSGDTLSLNNNISQKTDSQFVEKYLYKNEKLTPIVNLNDSTKGPLQLTIIPAE